MSTHSPEQETIHINKVFASLDALKTAVWEECEEDGKTAKFLYPYYGKKRPAAFICGCELGRQKVSDLGKFAPLPASKVEMGGVGLSASCQADGADISMSMDVSKEGMTSVKAGAAKGSCSIHANIQGGSQTSQSSELPEASPSQFQSTAQEGNSGVSNPEEEAAIREVRSCPRYLDHELRVQRREVCSFFVVS